MAKKSLATLFTNVPELVVMLDAILPIELELERLRSSLLLLGSPPSETLEMLDTKLDEMAVDGTVGAITDTSSSSSSSSSFSGHPNPHDCEALCAASFLLLLFFELLLLLAIW